MNTVAPDDENKVRFRITFNFVFVILILTIIGILLLIVARTGRVEDAVRSTDQMTVFHTKIIRSVCNAIKLRDMQDAGDSERLLTASLKFRGKTKNKDLLLWISTNDTIVKERITIYKALSQIDCDTLHALEGLK